MKPRIVSEDLYTVYRIEKVVKQYNEKNSRSLEIMVEPALMPDVLVFEDEDVVGEINLKYTPSKEEDFDFYLEKFLDTLNK